MIDTRSPGDKAKDEALAQMEAEHARKILTIRHDFLGKLLTNGSASLNDLDLPPDLRGRFLGSMHLPFVRMAITEVGLVRSSRKSSHCRRISVWGVQDYAKLRSWLVENPLPTPAPLLQQSLAFDAAGESGVSR